MEMYITILDPGGQNITLKYTSLLWASEGHGSRVSQQFQRNGVKPPREGEWALLACNKHSFVGRFGEESP